MWLINDTLQSTSYLENWECVGVEKYKWRNVEGTKCLGGEMLGVKS